MITLDEMWQRLTQHQPYADKRGYGADWMIMCKVRNHKAAYAAELAADAVSRVENARNGKTHEMYGIMYAADAAWWASMAIRAKSGNRDYAKAVSCLNKAEHLYDNP